MGSLCAWRCSLRAKRLVEHAPAAAIRDPQAVAAQYIECRNRAEKGSHVAHEFERRSVVFEIPAQCLGARVRAVRISKRYEIARHGNPFFVIGCALFRSRRDRSHLPRLIGSLHLAGGAALRCAGQGDLSNIRQCRSSPALPFTCRRVTRPCSAWVRARSACCPGPYPPSQSRPGAVSVPREPRARGRW